jgi:hypothetical protein
MPPLGYFFAEIAEKWLMAFRFCFLWEVVDLWKNLLKQTEKSEKSCVEDPSYVETRKTMKAFEKKFKLYIVFSVVYGLVFINWIDIVYSGYCYHIWLMIMYFFPFAALSIFFPRNWQLTVGLGLIASLMNDVFYELAKYLIGMPTDLSRYYSLWLIPGNEALFKLNLGFTLIQVYSWMMALSIYGRIVIVYVLLRVWKAQAKIRCLNQPQTKRTLFKIGHKTVSF